MLYPIRTASGTLVTRGFPLDPRPGERVDHPHHVGLWFNYGDVNGFDFWNNSDAIADADRPKMGTIEHRGIAAATGGTAGILTADSDWLLPDGRVVLKQRTVYTFTGDKTTRTIDLDITLTAQDTRVALTDNKEGVLGLRVTRALEEPSNKPEVFTDASGRATPVASMDNTGVNGVYLTSEGTKGAAVWGTRGRWCLLSGVVASEPVGIAIFDRPGNPGYPTYWHARGYGLFAANPLGQKALSNGKETLDFAIAPHQSARFRYRVRITNGRARRPRRRGGVEGLGPVESSRVRRNDQTDSGTLRNEGMRSGNRESECGSEVPKSPLPTPLECTGGRDHHD